VLISIINQAHERVPDIEMQRTLRAINQQIEYDFAPMWGLPATVRLEGSVAKRPRNESAAADARGDAVIYVWQHVDPDGVLGYHERNFRGVPYGVVFVEMSDALDEPWSVTLSHEVLETIADPMANLYVAGPHPKDRRRHVFYWQEVCDAVQTQTYRIDDVPVSNFVLPSYFCAAVEGMRNDFLVIDPQHPLQPFAIADGGYVGYYDPHKKKTVAQYAERDTRAIARLKAKQRGGKARRAIRYKL